MHVVSKAVSLGVTTALLLTGLVVGDCLAYCLACWRLKGVIVRLEDGTRIKGYVTWNQEWADWGYHLSTVQLKAFGQLAPATKKRFPAVIFDPLAQIDDIAVYTHLRSIKYPVKNALVAIRGPIVLKVIDIREVKVNPGPHDGYVGAGSLPLVSQRIADLLQTKPVASCKYEEATTDVHWVSYDKSFPEAELRRLCEQKGESDKEVVERLKARDIFSLDYDWD